MNQPLKTPSPLRREFLLDPDVVYLNHGSYGATPRVVFETYQDLTARLEQQPVRFLQREVPGMLANARGRLAEFIGCDKDEVVFVPNPTFAANTIARSLPLEAGDEVLTTNQEYGACLFAFRFMSQKAGFKIIEHQLSLPPSETLVDDFWRSVTPKTKAIFLSHITSPTALTLPVGEICRRARKEQITTFIDGAHVPGQIDVNVHNLDADFYTGACHKWLMAPKGASFLYARRDHQQLLEPLVVGWGWGDDRTVHVGSDFLDYHEWIGTHNPAAYLAVPAAIDFQRDRDWPSVRAYCRTLARSAVERAAETTGLPPLCDASWHVQMGLIEVSADSNLANLKHQLYSNHGIEVPVIDWHDRKFLRISVQGYNTDQDVEIFLAALETELSRKT